MQTPVTTSIFAPSRTGKGGKNAIESPQVHHEKTVIAMQSRSFQRNPPLWVGEIIFGDEILPSVDEIAAAVGGFHFIHDSGFHLCQQISSLREQGFHCPLPFILYSRTKSVSTGDGLREPG